MILSEWLTGRHKDVYATAAGDTTKAYYFFLYSLKNVRFLSSFENIYVQGPSK